MSNIVRYLTHPQVDIDASIPVPDWRLNSTGRARAKALSSKSIFGGTRHIFTSNGRKAIETAKPIARALKIPIETREGMHENDRSATGFLPPPEFEAAADKFFANPDASFRGWERAVDAQARIVKEVEEILSRNTTGDILIIGHGAVGTLLYCYYATTEISRIHDQPAGGGNFFAFHKEGRRIIHAWRSLEEAR